MDSIKLTIAIPTFNRSETLNHKLKFISRLADCDKFITLICDNCSDDKTTEIVESYFSKIGNLRYQKNEKNLGYDANVLKCLKLATTDYVWVLSDDDDFLEDTPAVILEYIEKYSPDLICLNDGGHELSLRQVKTVGDELLDLNIGRVSVLKNLDESQRYAYLSTFFWLTRLVVKKNKSLNFNRLEKFIGSQFVQLAIVNEQFNVLDRVRLIYSDVPLVKNNPHCVFSHNFTDVFVNKFYDFCMLPESRFSEKFALSVARANIPFVVNGLLAHKVGSKVFKYDFKFFYLLKKMFKYKCSYGLILKFIIIYFTPTKLIRMLKKTNNPCIENKEKRTYI
ncbi:MAG: hypothetical protein COZ36_01720 [Piscirickettsiaceae bacterium CG_4_10_14_3_um_filter_44_349]|nr:glycosyltransferase family 2 protein [Thiomicrospira sp.]OIP96288.1 MAG: hypothetical protein AUK56_02660 [Thiomicrospira sp. CG2_30_44_34]PIQ04447.1 MAG: hypothetical protein COW74_05100 [Piscirickettsiaceae bacterium CG18_big_fil_WC_8_21_14_2_50_44_103]PIX80670.1 MAG: hypothetical protein COZ36_01720 [Piscirickettsiaceae bacterium CG_4_10_14_3_um_filter_44_349]PIY77482.1 MAG: hypothetical protein COY84_00510 [Piscirickettsiaceae bacterium CG_4_10_14_0_8_um_filter_44_742]